MPIAVPWTAETAAAAANGFGLLRTVPTSANAASARWNYWQDYPFYSGPCGPVADDCSCNHGCCNHSCCDHHWCDHGCHPLPPMPLPPMPVPPDPDPEPTCPPNATFIAGSPLNLAAGDNITLSAISTDTEGFIPTTGGIRILNAGTYMVTYTVQIPAGEAVASRFVLTLDGGNIASSALDVNVSAANETNTSYTMQALIQAGDNSLLNLTTLGALSLTTTGAANVVTLSIVQVC